MGDARLRVAVVGATGFVGRAVVVEATRAGHHVKPVRAPRLVTAARDIPQLLHEARAWLTDNNEFSSQFEGVDAIINAAGLATPGSSLTDDLVGANSLLPAVLAEACANEGVARFVQISSAAVHGDVPLLDEHADVNPQSPYGVSKRWGELVLCNRAAPTCVIYRPTSVHGPSRSVTRALERLAQSPLSSVAGDGRASTPQVLVENVARAAVFLATVDEVPNHPVLHPSEGATTAGVLHAMSGRRPLHIPAPVARGVLMIAKQAGRLHPRIGAQARRLEMLWFGQRQAPGWLEESSYRPITTWADWTRES